MRKRVRSYLRRDCSSVNKHCIFFLYLLVNAIYIVMVFNSGFPHRNIVLCLIHILPLSSYCFH